jgi:hypothetical protein
MKEFEISEDDEFFEPVGQSVVPEDEDIMLYLQRDQIIKDIATRIADYIQSNRLIEVYLNLAFRTNEDHSNYINITYRLDGNG